jgi:hypothetical protein
MTPLLTGVFASQISGRLSVPDTGAMFPIAMVNVGSAGAASIQFNSIPQTYKHLQIRFIAKTTTAAINSDTTQIKLNGNAMTKNHYLYADGSSASSGVGGVGDVNNTPRANYASVFGAEIVDILNYTNPNINKTVRSFGGYDANGVGEMALYSNLYATNTNPITTITLTPSGNNFAQYSQFALYGIKG